MAAAPPLVLASRSPQRRALLERIGVAFRVVEVDVQELGDGDPSAVAAENARRKATAGAASAAAGELVLGVDTLVAIGGAIHGKPPDERAARAVLTALGGATHAVHSAVATIRDGQMLEVASVTQVRFRRLDDALLDWYLATGEWRGRAGGYAIQGAGAVLVEAIEGDYSNVVGLPLPALLELHPELLR